MSEGSDDDFMNDKKEKTHFYTNWSKSYLATSMYREIIKRLQAFGLINLIVETSKITDNSYLQLFVYFDEMRNAFSKNEIYQEQQHLIELHKEN